MSKIRKAVIALLAAMTLGVYLAPAAAADPNCSPGQQGNPHPGFKPGSCK